MAEGIDAFCAHFDQVAEAEDFFGCGATSTAIGLGDDGVIAFAVHAALAVTAGSLLTLAPHKIVQIVVAAVFLAGAVLVLRVDKIGRASCRERV